MAFAPDERLVAVLVERFAEADLRGADFFAEDFFVAGFVVDDFFAAGFFVAVFFAVAFFAADFFAVDFFTVVFFAGAFFAADFFAERFFAAAFFEEDFFAVAIYVQPPARIEACGALLLLHDLPEAYLLSQLVRCRLRRRRSANRAVMAAIHEVDRAK